LIENASGLSALFKREFLETVTDVETPRYTGKAILLKEKENQAPQTLQKVFLALKPNEEIHFVLKLDQASPSNLFNGYKGENRRCDYVISTHLNQTNYLIFIELKSKELRDEEIQEKFDASNCVISYATKLLEKFYHQQTPRFETRFVLLYLAPSVRKTSVMSQTTSRYAYKKISCHNDKLLYFQHLLN
jgi:hypothetical protein